MKCKHDDHFFCATICNPQHRCKQDSFALGAHALKSRSIFVAWVLPQGIEMIQSESIYFAWINSSSFWYHPNSMHTATLLLNSSGGTNNVPKSESVLAIWVDGWSIFVRMLGSITSECLTHPYRVTRSVFRTSTLQLVPFLQPRVSL